jgi:hypothetical protein
MACPSCGGNDKVLVAPNYWECRSQVTEYHPGRVPDPMYAVEGIPIPSGATMPVTDVVYRPCGVRYHEAAGITSTPLCGCSTFAIGLCAACGKPVCGDCSGPFDGKRLCVQHLRASEEVAARAAREAWLTPEKFLALAAAAGNPGLQSWTIRKHAKVPHEYRAGLLLRTKVYYTEEVLGTYEIRGWGLKSCLGIFTDEGRIHSVEHNSVNGDGRSSLWESKSFDERAMTFDDPKWGWGKYSESSPEQQDRDLREMCARYRIPVSN